MKIAQTVATVFCPTQKSVDQPRYHRRSMLFKECMVLSNKKDFFPGEVCPLYFSEKSGCSKSKHVHRKVKYAHLVPELGSR